MKKNKAPAQTVRTQIDSTPGSPRTMPRFTSRHPLGPILICAAAAIILITLGVLIYSYREQRALTQGTLISADPALVYDIEVENPSIKLRFNRLVLTWDKPADSTLKEIIIKKESGSGSVLVYRGTGKRFVDKEWTAAARYRIICISREGYFSRGIELEVPPNTK